MRERSYPFRILAVLAAMVAMSMPAIASVPEKPLDPRVMTRTSRVSYYTMTLTWRRNPAGDAPTGFHVYEARGARDTATFQLIATVPNDPAANDDKLYAYSKENFEGPYWYYVTAYNDDGEGEPSRLTGLSRGGPMRPEGWYFLGGVVRDDQTGAPLYALVTLDGLDSVGRRQSQVMAATDPSTGEWVAIVPPLGPDTFAVRGRASLRYIVSASIMNANNQPSEWRQIYDRVTLPQAGTPLDAADSNRSIDFVFRERAHYTNGFSGRVTDMSSASVHARLSLVPVGTYSDDSGILVETDSSGYYTIRDVPPGDYLVLVAPTDGVHLPGYYVAGDVATADFSGATAITIGETMSSTAVTILVGNASESNGSSSVLGVVNGDDGSGNTVPLAGVNVLAVNGDGEAVAYALTNGRGEFNVSGIGGVGMAIVAGKAGWRSSTTSMPNLNGTVQTAITLNRMTSNAPIVESSAAMTLHLSPVPAQSELHVALPQGTSRVIIVDNTGTVVTQQRVAATAQLLTLDISGLASGAYRLVVDATGGIVSRGFTVVR